MSMAAVEFVSANELESAIHSRGEINHDHALRYLAETIGEVGIQQPLLVRGPKKPYGIIDGNRRFAAGLMMGVEKFPVIQADPNLSDAEALQRSLICNCARLDLSPVDRGRTYRTMIESFGWTIAEVAKRTCTSSPSISRLTTMLMAPPEILRRVHEGNLSADVAYHIAIIRDPEAKARFVQDALVGRLTRDELVKRIKSGKKGDDRPRPRQPPPPKPPRIVIPLGDRRSLTVTGSDLTLQAFVEWLEATLNRFRLLEPRDMELRDAFGIVNASKS